MGVKFKFVYYGTLYPQKLALASLTSCGRYSSLTDLGHGVF
jgi:hypothetical protein